MKKLRARLVIDIEAEEEFALDMAAKDIADAAMALGAIRVDQKTTYTIAERMD